MKKKTPAQQKKILWKLVSEYVRRKDIDSNGEATCFTCGRKNPWKMMHCGHYVRASAGLSTYFEPRNLNVQCYACNIWRDGNSDEYALKLQKKYGESVLKELNALKGKIIKDYPYEREIKKYKDLLAKL